MAFVNRLLRVQFDLGEGTFGTDGSTSVVLDGLRMTVEITQPGIPSMAQLTAQIYGMTLSQMNTLSTLGQVVTNIRKNTITIYAADQGAAFSQIFKGTIFSAMGNFAHAPDIPFVVAAQAGLYESVAPYAPTSIKGSVPAATLLQQFAKSFQGGMPFENDGVTAILSNPYCYGSLQSQIFQVLKQASAYWNGGDGNIFAVWPANGYRPGTGVPLISAATGMIGYPSFTQNGMTVNSIFQPSITFGRLIEVQSSIKLPLTPNGQWQVQGLTYNLQSQTPRGDWFMEMTLVPPGFVGTPPL